MIFNKKDVVIIPEFYQLLLLVMVSLLFNLLIKNKEV